jgi:thymidylate synthase
MYEHNYLELLTECLASGEIVEGRNGETRSLFGVQFEIRDLEEAVFPILTTRKMYPDGIFGELAAFLQGATMLQQFKNYGCNYWDANAAAWLPNRDVPQSMQKVGRIYGAQWRNFNGHDQLKKLLLTLKTDPTSRRHLLTAYNPAEVDQGCLPPCHLLAQYSVRRGGILESIVYMRSVDLVLGLPTDVVLYATLQLLLAREIGVDAGAITFMLGDAHIYENHLALIEEQINRAPYPQPVLEFLPGTTIWNFRPGDVVLNNYEHHDAIAYPFNV